MFEKIYIINLKRHTERKSRVIEELEGAGLHNYEFINAISGDDLPDTSELISSGVLSKTFIDPNGILTKNIIACALSHKLAYKKMLEDGVQRALILEDDVLIDKSFVEILLNGGFKRIRLEMNIVDWDIFMWGLVGDNIPHYTGIPSNLERVKEYKKFSPDWAAHAYEITREGASKLIENNTPVKFAADVNLETANTNVYCTPFSYFKQSAGLLNRFDTSNLEHQLNDLIWGKGVEISSTFSEEESMGSMCGTPMYDIYFSPDRSIRFERRRYQVDISKKIEFKSIEFKTYIDSFGFDSANWCFINF